VVVVVDVQQRVFRLGDDRNFQVVTSWDEFVASFAGEDVFGDKVALGVTMLAGLDVETSMTCSRKGNCEY